MTTEDLLFNASVAHIHFNTLDSFIQLHYKIMLKQHIPATTTPTTLTTFPPTSNIIQLCKIQVACHAVKHPHIGSSLVFHKFKHPLIGCSSIFHKVKPQLLNDCFIDLLHSQTSIYFFGGSPNLNSDTQLMNGWFIYFPHSLTMDCPLVCFEVR